MIILLDMDGVLADFESGFVQAWKSRYPDLPFIPAAQRKRFSLIEEYPPELTPNVRSIYQSEGFYRGLSPISGSIDAVRRLRESGHDVWLCSTPILSYKYCVPEKFGWVEEHLGGEWTAKIILTRDKTLISGDLLIDDKPEITGLRAPSWEHIVYDQPYNRSSARKRRLTWSNWADILLPGNKRVG